MSKELETLEKLLSFAFVMSENMVGLTKGNYNENKFIKKTYEYLNKYNVDLNSKEELKKALQRLESIDNSKASEALECLKQVEDVIETKIGLGVVNTYIINIIKQALLNAQELETMAEEYDLQPAQIREALLVYRMMSSAGYKVADIEKAQKQEEVLQIIRRKGLPIIERNMLMQCENYEQYCTKYDNYNMINASIRKTEEEFNLLKRYYYEDNR